ncbi:hypothetical protein SY83_16720 [Paenibacillus swuensis]|uniref:FAD-binding PCMH-type domain-containing protein n=1 Tax=Paenibacillus swuensis TaxID=1178515 RepID=A0A172TKZ6_9BACL|nr:FAD binding domain-containing protein [Paenibacillus swuensis]ANE47652.1 hypothetical protein SY83_16720 [Paenibacillus swuensis]
MSSEAHSRFTNQHVPNVWHPRSAMEAFQWKQHWGNEAEYIAGGTLLRTQWESGVKGEPRHLINLGSVQELHHITDGPDGITIGAQTTLEKCRNDVSIRENLPLLTEALRQIAAPSIRNLGTIGGNVMYGYGDSLPSLLLYDAELLWLTDKGEMLQSIQEWLLRLHSDQDPSSLLMQIRIPWINSTSFNMNESCFGAFYKIGRREAFTPSVVTAALLGQVDDNQELRGIRIAAGGGLTLPVRLAETEKVLTGKKLNQELLKEAYTYVQEEYKPVADVFASEAYRRTTAANLVTSELWKAAQGRRNP